MWKILAIIAVALTFSIYLPPWAEAQEGTGRTATKSSDKADPPAITYVDNRRNETKAQDPQNKPPNRYISPEWALVIVGIITFIVIGWQSAETHRAATASKTSAEAALKQADHMVASERAWIVESINFPNKIPRQPKTGSAGLVVGIVILQNSGRQPAFLRTMETRFHVAESLPSEPTFRFKKVFDDGYVLAPQETAKIRVLLEEGSFDDEDADRIEVGRDMAGSPVGLYLYGRVVYETLCISRENSFCYTWKNLMGIVLEGDKPGLQKEGPKGYNKQT